MWGRIFIRFLFRFFYLTKDEALKYLFSLVYNDAIQRKCTLNNKLLTALWTQLKRQFILTFGFYRIGKTTYQWTIDLTTLNLTIQEISGISRVVCIAQSSLSSYVFTKKCNLKVTICSTTSSLYINYFIWGKSKINSLGMKH